MICLDTSVLLDYLDGDETAKTAIEERSRRPFVAPSIVLFELYRGAARTGGREAVGRVESSLDWVWPLEGTAETAREASLIEAELLDRGEPINLADVLVAGACRSAGATLLTRDRDFERVPDLDVEVVPRETGQ